MPRFDSNGNLYAGIGGGDASINGRIIASNAGGTCPLSAGVAILQVGAQLYTCTVDGEARVFDPQGANELAAGGGVYAAKFNGVVRVSNDPQTYPGWGVGDVGPDGSVLLLTPDGLFNGRLVRDLQSLGGPWWSGLGAHFRPIQSDDIQAPTVLPGAIYGYRRRGDYCCYLHESGQFIVQHLNRLVGKVLSSGLSGAFRPDLVVLPDGMLAVTYSRTEGERPGDLAVWHLSPADLNQEIKVTPPPPPPPPPPPKEIIVNPTTVGVVDGKLVDPHAYIDALREGQPADRWREVLTAMEPHIYKFGLGFQKGSDGVHRGRAFFPHAGCRDVRPRPDHPDEMRLGVRQEPAAWESYVDIVHGEQWAWEHQSGPEYVPIGDVIDPPPPPPPSDVTKRLEALEGLTRQQSLMIIAQQADHANLKRAFDLMVEADTKEFDRLDRLFLQLRDRKMRAKGGTGRTFGHAHGFDVEVIPE